MSTDTIIKDKTVLSPTDNGDHDLFSHYVRKEDIARAAVEGVPVIALCGKQWTPTRPGDKFPVCAECTEIYKTLIDA